MEPVNSDDRAQDLVLRDALAPESGAVDRIVASAVAVARGGRVRDAASTPLLSGRGKSGGSSLRGAASRPRLERFVGVRWVAAALCAAAGLGLGFWLSSQVRSFEPALLIANQGSVYVLRDRGGAVRVVSGEALADDGASRSSGVMFLLHGGVR
jgi:hypothetical protein